MATTEMVMVVEEVVPHFMDGTSMDLRLDLTHLVAPDNLPSHRRHLSPNHSQANEGGGWVREKMRPKETEEI